MIRKCLLALIQAYQRLLSPLLGPRCRFYPSCSHYAQEALERHGVKRGLVLTVKRLLRCHPGTKGGVDLVPSYFEKGNINYSDFTLKLPL